MLAAVAARMPWALQEDVEAFEKRWSQDREACARDADAGREALRQPPVQPMQPEQPAVAQNAP